MAGVALTPAARARAAARTGRHSAVEQVRLDQALGRAAELSAVRAPLERERDRWHHAIHPLFVLERIGAVIPPDGQLTTFEIDSAHVQISVSAPSLAPVLRRLERQNGIADVALIGGIAHDSTVAGQVERAVIRFRIAAEAP
jgi:hypothetical protein